MNNRNQRPQRELLDFDAACIYLSRNSAYLRRLVADRRIRHYRMDGRLRFDRADLDDFLDGCLVEVWP